MTNKWSFINNSRWKLKWFIAFITIIGTALWRRWWWSPVVSRAQRGERGGRRLKIGEDTRGWTEWGSRGEGEGVEEEKVTGNHGGRMQGNCGGVLVDFRGRLLLILLLWKIMMSEFSAQKIRISWKSSIFIVTHFTKWNSNKSIPYRVKVSSLYFL